MKELNQDCQAMLQAQFDAHQASGLKMKDYLDHTTFCHDGRHLNALYFPKVFTPEDLAIFKNLIVITHTIFEKIIRRYQCDADYRKLFPFSDELAELIAIPSGYDSVLPMARFDIFYDEATQDFKFCEINTDGTSAMNEVRELNNALHYNLGFRKLTKYHDFKSFKLFDTWIDRMMNLYRHGDAPIQDPTVAIVDFIDDTPSKQDSLAEFRVFQRHFEKKGVHAVIADIRSLTYTDGVLRTAEGDPVHVIYRRAVTADILEHYDEVQGFIAAVKDQAVTLFGPMCTQVIHNKWLFAVIHNDATKAFLSPAENEFVALHFPMTRDLTEDAIRDLDALATKDRWIVKPMDGYACHGVYAGVDCSDEQWRDILTEYAEAPTIIQEYVTPYRSANIDFSSRSPRIEEYINMTGLYVFDGRFAGFYSRQSNGGIVRSGDNEKVVPTLEILEEEFTSIVDGRLS